LGLVGTRRLLDIAALCLLFAAFAGLGNVEVLLQACWVTLGVGAFLYGLRVAVLRILMTSLLAALYFIVVSSVSLASLESEEWPLMIGVALIVAVLADRSATSAARYATLYRQASERLLTAHQEERARLARDLHDGVGQTLTAVLLTLDAAEAELAAGPTWPAPVARSTIQRAHTLAASALDEARDVAAQLRPIRIHEIGLGAALFDLAGAAGVPVEVRFDPATLPPGLLQPEREIDAYRIVQEAIGNAARHSRANHIWVDLRASDREVGIEVGDDGAGFDGSTRTRGLGLAGMHERAAMIRARLDVRSRPGEGTIVKLVIPFARGAADEDRSGATRPAVGVG
jgi:signal transduction histidine kinase